MLDLPVHLLELFNALTSLLSWGNPSQYSSSTLSTSLTPWLGTLLSHATSYMALADACYSAYKWHLRRNREKNSLTAQFREGDTAYEWLKNFLMEQNVSPATRNLEVTACMGNQCNH